MPVEVSTPVFEGPFDLLLHLILREQVDLYEVSLADIVDAYLVELARMRAEAERLDLELATEFLLIAATLVELKLRRLLPGRDDPDLDEELGLWEERDLLLARLVEHKTFRDAAAALAGLAAAAADAVPRRAGPDERFAALTPDPLAGVTPERLRAAYVRAVTPRPQPRVDMDHVAPIRASVVDAVAELVDELARARSTTFRALTDSLVDRIEVIVRFLAVLELYKRELVEIEQAGTFGEITLRWTASGDLAAALADLDTYEG